MDDEERMLANLIFERIKHGDEKHQDWLRHKSFEVAKEWFAKIKEVPSGNAPA